MTRSSGDQQVSGWEVVFDGYGPGLRSKILDGVRVLELEPNAAKSPARTHAVLAVRDGVEGQTAPIGPDGGCGDSLVTAEMRTLAQLREGSPANVWEAAWLVWRYRDPEHFYYLILKPNGWELGKRDPAYEGGQRFLTSGEQPLFPVGETWHRVEVRLDGSAMHVLVDGQDLTTFTDDERPYECGRVGLYTEDARVQFRNVRSRLASPAVR